jgi:pyruvate-formate lyase-activating enzyme
MLKKGVLKYIRDKELNIKLEVIDIPKKRRLRPEFQKLMEFLAAALDNDMPVAFLNLHNGKVKELESWHWVTIISIEYDESQAYADILDEGIIKKIDLAEWFNTTIIGGGFVSFNRL